jgi:hypothetical protein
MAILAAAVVACVALELALHDRHGHEADTLSAEAFVP